MTSHGKLDGHNSGTCDLARISISTLRSCLSCASLPYRFRSTPPRPASPRRPPHPKRQRAIHGETTFNFSHYKQNFMNLSVGHDARQPLPGPPTAATALRQRALALMEEWNEAHGDIYKGLRAAYRYLREGKRMKFPELQVCLNVFLDI